MIKNPNRRRRRLRWRALVGLLEVGCDPAQTTKTSVRGAINVPGLAKRVKARMFYAAASEVCCDPDLR